MIGFCSIIVLILFFLLLLGMVIYFIITNRQQVSRLEAIQQDMQKEIAERIQAEATKQKLERALLQGQKLQSIGTLAGGIAHDFNNILYAICGYTEMAREDAEKNSILYNNLGKILQASERGRDLISRILSFSRRQQHELVPLNIKETIEGVLSLLTPTIPSSTAIQLEANNVDCIILGNQTLLHQILVNIINNAVDAMDGEGTIHIRLSQILAHNELLQQFPNILDTNYCMIEIKDTGTGMDNSTLERIFEPFFTTKEVGKGTGLGLATVHALVKEHNGYITVSSQLGAGSLFTILIPEYSQGE